jgi:hypothetical protein
MLSALFPLSYEPRHTHHTVTDRYLCENLNDEDDDAQIYSALTTANYCACPPLPSWSRSLRISF